MITSDNLATFELPIDIHTETLIQSAAQLTFKEIELEQQIGNPDFPPEPELYIDQIRYNRTFLTIDRAGNIIGAAVFRSGKFDASLESLAVSPSRRGEGEGAKLLALVEEAVREDGHTELALVPTDESESFYAKFGYKPTDKKREVQDPSYWVKELK